MEVKDSYTFCNVTYIPTGEYRTPQKGERFLNSIECVEVAGCDYDIQRKVILKPKRWRAKIGKDGYYFVSSFNTVEWAIDDGLRKDNMRHLIGNYYEDLQTAQWAADEYKELTERLVYLRWK